MRIIIILFLFLLSYTAHGQLDERFRFASVHTVEERSSYSIFYPLNKSTYKGVVVLIHSNQASNPAVYGNFINKLLNENLIVIYPSFQSFAQSNNKLDKKYISESLDQAYDDIKLNYEDIMSLPVAFIGHSMGGVIVYEMALGQISVPKKPSCVISVCPAEVRHHKLDKLDYNKLDSYDVYLVIEEEKDKFYRRGTGKQITSELHNAKRKKYILHNKSEDSDSKHLNFWSHNKDYSSKNNTLVTYFRKRLGKTNQVDKEVYWPIMIQALDCAFSRQDCDTFRTQQ